MFRVPIALGAAVALVAASVAVATEHLDAPDPGTPLDLRSATLVQHGGDLRWDVQLGAPLDGAGLAAGGGRRLCLLLRYGVVLTPRERVCAVTDPGPEGVRLRVTRLDSAGRPTRVRLLAARIARPAPERLVASFAIDDVGLRTRRFNWQVVTTSPGAPADLLPDAGVVFARTVAPVPAGCVARGPAEVRSAPGHPRAVALTFDDGPGPDTARVLGILERERVPATFFVVGSQVAGHAAELRRMLGDGDALGNHSYTHANLASGGTGEIARTQRAIHRASGYTPCLLRPPYGATSATLVAEVRAARMTSVLWNVDPRDWSTPGAGAISGRVLSQTRRGSIVLLHDGGGGRGETVAALRRIISVLRHRGYRFETLPELLGYRTTF